MNVENRSKMKKAAALTAAVLIAYYSNWRIYTNALQSSSSFPRTPRRHDLAHRYLDDGHLFTFGYFNEGHPFTYDPTNGVNVAERRDFRYYRDPSPSVDEINQTNMDELVKRPKRTMLTKCRLSPHPPISSILHRQARRKQQTSDLLNYDEEREIVGEIRNLRFVTRARENLSDWMSRESNRVEGNQHMEPSEHQWASACSLSVDQLHDVMARGHEARTKLIKANVGLVTVIAKRYYDVLSYGSMGGSSGGGIGGTDATLKLDDLIQEGHMGIMEAAERFDPRRGCRFSTYATHWIRQRIVRSIAESARMIRLPVYVQTMIRNMHKTCKELEQQIGRQPSMPELAHEMGVPLDKINLYQHLSKNVLSLEIPIDRHSKMEDKRTLGDRVACTEIATPDEDIMSEALRGEVHAMLDTLGQVERLILTHRFGLYDGRPKSVRETAEGMGISSNVARNMEAKALSKLRQPRMSYRVKDYVAGPEVFCGEMDTETHHGGAHCHKSMVIGEEEQLQHPYHYPHHMSVAKSSKNEITRHEDSAERERPTPESIWSF